jgi:cysteine desulfurase
MGPLIDFDHNATTPLHPRVREAMVALLQRGDLGNPSSVHGRGRAARGVVEGARRAVAEAVGADPLMVTFTSGGTEAANLAVLGVAHGLRRKSRPSGLLTSRLEHPAVARAADELRVQGHAVVHVDHDAHGRIDPAAVGAALTAHPEIGLVSLQASNHELGNMHPIEAIARAAKTAAPEVLVHTDAVQAFGRVPVQIEAWGVDLLSVSSHKIHGPPGAGALVHGKSLAIDPMFHGGHQERGRRVGTEAWIALHGFGVAASLVASELGPRAQWTRELRGRLVQGLVDIGARLHGDQERHVGNTVNAAFEGAPGELLCMALDLEGIAVSTGAACSAGTLEPSPVLLALGLPRERAAEAIRISLGPDNTAAEVDTLLSKLPAVIARVRAAGFPSQGGAERA